MFESESSITKRVSYLHGNRGDCGRLSMVIGLPMDRLHRGKEAMVITP